MRKPYENEPKPVLSYEEFTFKNKEFVAYASDFIGRETHFYIYNDACDRGIAIKGKGEVVVYYLSHENVVDGEITHWEYRPTAESKKRVPACVGTSVKIFND